MGGRVGLEVGERDQGAVWGLPLGDHVPVWARGWPTEVLVKPVGQLLGEDGREVLRLLVGRRPVEPKLVGEPTLQEPM
jgi:hypothetical protein